MTRFTRIAIAVLLSASSLAISETSPRIQIFPDAKIVLPHEVQSFLQPAGQDSSRSSCLESCQSKHTSCLSSARSDDAKSVCETQFNACNSACPMNKY
jgi:hypothetical protein